MKRRFFLALCLLSALATGSAQAQPNNALRISYVRSPFNLQLMVMKEKGILQKHLAPLGLQAQWPEINSGAKQAQALASGDLDMGGVMNTTSVLLAEGEGNPVRIVAGVSRPTDVFAIVAGKNGPRTVAGLKGKAIAGPKGTVLHQLLVAALAREGIGMQQVNFLQMDLPKAFAAVQSGQIDAALLAANFVLNAQKDGSHVLTRATGLVTPILVMTASDKFLQKHPDRVKAVVAAHDEAWQWIQANKEDAIALGAKLQNISVDEARQLYNWSHFTQRLKPSDFQAMEKDVQFMLDNGMMRNRVDVRKIVVPSALEATAK
ncbi:MAG: aliphatic sulfonate ABC transporter substrate-binding protein [Brachymonas sp.]|nr:aliphatic sulfonate ABC transporter substrate-binding protein [Brachymonas sp.]